MVPTELVRSGMGPTVTVVWMVLRSHAGNRTMVAWPNVGTLARETGCSERTVKRAIQTLRMNGWISVKKRYGRSNSYLLHETPLTQSGQYGPISEANMAPQN